MIDPNNVTNYYRSHYDLLEFWLFCLFVRGKNAKIQAQKLQTFLDSVGGLKELCALHAEPGIIEAHLRYAKTGQYKTLTQAVNYTLRKLVGELDRAFLLGASIQELESVPGVGPKTARFFVLHSRKDARVAVLDTHLMKFLQVFLDEELPQGTPASAGLYARLEQEFLRLADGMGVSPADLDLAVWRAYSEGRGHIWRLYLDEILLCNAHDSVIQDERISDIGG